MRCSTQAHSWLAKWNFSSRSPKPLQSIRWSESHPAGHAHIHAQSHTCWPYCVNVCHVAEFACKTSPASILDVVNHLHLHHQKILNHTRAGALSVTQACEYVSRAGDVMMIRLIHVQTPHRTVIPAWICRSIVKFELRKKNIRTY